MKRQLNLHPKFMVPHTKHDVISISIKQYPYTGESYDSATLRATGTFSNKGTLIGTPKATRAYLGSTSSAGGNTCTVVMARRVVQSICIIALVL